MIEDRLFKTPDERLKEPNIFKSPVYPMAKYCDIFAPPGFRFFTNVNNEGEVGKYEENWGKDNVHTSTPAYDVDNNPWNGIAIYIRIGATNPVTGEKF